MKNFAIVASLLQSKLESLHHSVGASIMSDFAVVKCGYLSDLVVLELILFCKTHDCTFSIIADSNSLSVHIRPLAPEPVTIGELEKEGRI